MQFQVPQFIETEDKIIGPLTIRQFVYIIFAGILCFVLYFTVETWLFVMLSAVFLGAALALGMVKISGRPLTHVIRAAFNYYWKPQLYLWQTKTEKPNKGVTLETLSVAGGRPEDIMAGSTLRNAWQRLQTGSKVSDRQFLGKNEQYQIYQKLSGDRHAARRIDYR